MINNRQGGRRRGRGGGPRTPNQSPSPGNNRQENRSRGNASQLLEKYKSMARDAQLQGDRVQAEYYLQYADHYFRVLNESRVRFEEQRRQRDDYSPDEDEDQDDSGAAMADGDDRDDRDDREDRNESGRNDYRGERDGETQRPRSRPQEREENEPQRQRSRPQNRDENRESPRPRSRPQERVVNRDEERDEERISLEVLPPAISIDGDAPKAPRRRTRRPREGDEEIAPAA